MMIMTVTRNIAVAIAMVTLLATGCVIAFDEDGRIGVEPITVTVPGTEPTRASAGAFMSRQEGEDGVVVEWTGVHEGHRAGQRSDFEFKLANRGKELWQGRYCFVLLDQDGVVTTFEQGDFSLRPGEDLGRHVKFTMPADLPDGNYGLALVIPDRLANTVSVTVGSPTDPYTGPWPQPLCPDEPDRETLVITLYFGNKQFNPDLVDPGLVFPVERTIPTDADVAEAVLEQLFAGPTDAEIAEGYVSSFSSETRSILRSVRVDDATVYVDLVDIRPLMPYVSTSFGSQAFLAEVDATLMDAMPVERVIYAIAGDPATFYEWVQIGCHEDNDFCDPTPFEAAPSALDSSASRLVVIPETELTFEAPAGWSRLESEWVWKPGHTDGVRIGVNWANIRPPQEVEAALLPNHAVVIDSEPVAANWGVARRYTVEVYAPAAEGENTQPILESVETHVIVTVDEGNVRRAFDFYASARTADQLADLESTLQKVLDSVTLGEPE